MNLLLHYRRLVFCSFVLLSGSGCSFLRRPGPVIDVSQDNRIQADVQARLNAEPNIQAEQLRVEVEGGIVRLYGTVQGMASWECAIRNAELVASVRTVVDYLIIQRGPREIACLAPRTLPARAGP